MAVFFPVFGWGGAEALPFEEDALLLAQFFVFDPQLRPT